MITKERREQLLWLFENETNEDETQDWRDELTDEEADMVALWERVVTETAAAVLIIAARAESLTPGGAAEFRDLLMAALSKDEVWDRSLIVTPEDQGAVQS